MFPVCVSLFKTVLFVKAEVSFLFVCPQIKTAGQAAFVKTPSPMDQWNCWGVIFSLLSWLQYSMFCSSLSTSKGRTMWHGGQTYPLVTEVMLRWPQLQFHTNVTLDVSIRIFWKRCGSSQTDIWAHFHSQGIKYAEGTLAHYPVYFTKRDSPKSGRGQVWVVGHTRHSHKDWRSHPVWIQTLQIFS